MRQDELISVYGLVFRILFDHSCLLPISRSRAGDKQNACILVSFKQERDNV